MGTRRWVLYVVLISFFILSGVFLYLLYADNGLKTQSDTTSVLLGKNITGMVNSRISAFQMSGEYRTVKIKGEIKDIYKEGENTIVELLISDDKYEASLWVDIGSDEDIVGVSARTETDDIRKDNWNNYNIRSLNSQLNKGDGIEVEVMTWISEDLDCSESEICLARLSSYLWHKESNSVIDKYLFQEIQLSDENLKEFNELDIIGPVITVSFVDL